MNSKFDNIRCFLLDLDGTVYLGNRLIDGAQAAIERMRARGRVIFLSNNSSRSRSDYVAKLTALGIPTGNEDIFTSSDATINYLFEQNMTDGVYLVGNDNLRGEFVRRGIIPTETNVSRVVVGFDTTLDYEKLCKACRFVSKGATLIATHPDFTCPIEDGFIPDVGSFLALIHAATGRRADVICGKPSSIMARMIMSYTGCRADELCMFGDRIMTDVAFAEDNGFLSAFVLSGEGTTEELAASGRHADIILDNIGRFDE